jgi:signal transduction histidine kinase
MSVAILERLKRPRLTGPGRVWLLNAALAAASALLWFAARSIAVPLVDGPDIPWWLLVAGFGLADVFVVHIRIARHAHSFSLSEIPLVLGIAFVSPGRLALAQAVGFGLALALHRRQKPIRLAFNVAQRSFTTLLAFLIVASGRSLAGVDWPAFWVAAFAATFAADMVAAILINAAISLSEGRLRLFDQVVGMGSALTFANTALALVAVMVVLEHPAGVVLVAVPAATTFLAGKAFADLQRKHENLMQLQRSTGLAQRSLRRDEMIPALLENVREMFNCDLAELVLLSEGRDRQVRYRTGPSTAGPVVEAVALDPAAGVWARVVSEREAVLLARPIRNEALRTFYGANGIRDAMVAPVLSDGDVLGLITAANRLGDFGTFDADDLDLLRTLTNHIGVALRNSSLLERMEAALAHETEMGRLKDDFVATVSHELRTPLTNVQGYLKTLLRPELPLTPADQEEFLASADRHAERLRHLIEDLLFASRVEASSEVQAPSEVIGVAGMLDRVVHDEVEGGDRVILMAASMLPPIRSREEDVGRIVRNLIDNALKYSPPDAPVIVSAQPDGAGVAIRIHDRGPGIDPHEQQRIFDRFYQVDHSMTRRVGGAGMGLYICRRAAERLGGRVWLERSDASGSVFGLWLPVDPPLEVTREADVTVIHAAV